MIGNIVAGTFSAGVAPVTSSYESIATTSLSSSQSSITFTESGSAWSSYKHLQLRAILRTTSGAYAGLQFNADTGNNYASHELLGNGSSASAGAYTSRADVPFFANATSSAANTFTSLVIDILDFKSTSKYKTVRMLGGWDANGSGYVQLQSGLWQSTNAITEVKLFAAYGQSLQQYSHFALYGIKD